MTYSTSHVRRLAVAFLSALGIAFAWSASRAAAQAGQQIVAGPNVDVIGGPVVQVHPWQGDPFGQRQDEASCFVDSRNPLVVACAYNDYTPVGIAGLQGDAETGDAWLGQSISTDGGATWHKYLFPGYPQDNSPIGTASPLHGFPAAADPTWRGGPNGRSYFSGIAFFRGGGAGVVFVQPYVNNNNVQNDPSPLKPDPNINGGQPVIIDNGNSGQFQDKTWLAVGADGKVYVTYATFLGGGNNAHSTIWAQVSTDGGKTFTRSKLSEGDKLSNGTIIAPHPDNPCWVDVSWRRRQSGTQTDAIEFVRSTDCGKSWTSPTTIVSLPPYVRSGDQSSVTQPFDQGTSSISFRNISSPAMTTDNAGRVYVAWADRIQSNDPTFGMVTRDSHIMLTVGTPTKANGNAVTWATPMAVDTLTGTPPLRGHQLRPSLWFASGKIYLSAAFTQQDQTVGILHRQDMCDPGKTGCDPNNPDATPDKTIATYVETRDPRGELLPSPPGAPQIGRAFTEFIADAAPASPTQDVNPSFTNQPPLKRRHTEEIGIWQGRPGSYPQNPAFPAFSFTKVTRFAFAWRTDHLETAQANPWGLTLHCGGNCAFAGDYDDVVAQAFVAKADGSGFAPNVNVSDTTPAYVAWTDNRFVRPFVPLTQFTPANSDPNGAKCSDQADATGTRNQEIMISRVGNGVYAYALGNQKAIGSFKRAFTIAIQNGINSTKHYRLSFNVSPSVASWKQFQSLSSIDLSLPPFTTGARELYVQGTNGPIRVNVVEITAPGGTPVAGGLQTFTFVNPDPTTPNLAPPIQDGTIDPTNPAANEIYTPDVTAPDVTAPDVTANVVVTPDVTAPDVTAPDVTAPDVTAVAPQFPDVTAPDVTAPDVTAPDVTAPDVTAPDVTAIGPGDQLTDTLVKVKNRSNVSAAFALKTFALKPLPPGFKLQLLATQSYYTVTERNCIQMKQVASALVGNIPNPALVTDPNALTFDPANGTAQELSIALPPGGEVIVNYRLLLPSGSYGPVTTDQYGRKHVASDQFNPQTDLVPVAIAQAVSTNVPVPPTCPSNPSTCPMPTAAAPLDIQTTSLLDGIVGQPYPGVTLSAIGGNPPYTFSALTPLPAGLALAPNGQISGTPAGPTGTFAVKFQVQDSSNPAQTATRALNIQIFPAELVVLNTDFVSAGFGGMRGDGTGTLTVSGVSGTVTKAVLYWHGPTNSTDPSVNSVVSFGGQSVTGTNIGFASDNCWGFQNSQAYRADVTQFVTGNGTYSLSAFLKMTGNTTTADINGVSLVVFFDDGNPSNNRDVYLHDGNDSNIASSCDPADWSDTLADVKYDGSGSATLELHVADGQMGGSSYVDGALTVNGITLVPAGDIFNGDSVPNGPGAAGTSGGLWDIKAYTLPNGILTTGYNTVTLTSPLNADCLSLIVMIVSVPHVP